MVGRNKLPVETAVMPRYRYDGPTAEAWLADEYQGCALPPRQPVGYPASKNLQAHAWTVDTQIHTPSGPWRMATGQRDTTKALRPGGPTAGITALGAGAWRLMPETVGTSSGLNTWDDHERDEFSSAAAVLDDFTPQRWPDPIPRRKAAELPKGNERMGLPELLLALGLGNECDWPRAKDYGNAIAYVKEVKPAAKVPADLRPHKVWEPMVRESGWSPAVDEDDRTRGRGAFHGGMRGSGEQSTMRPGFWNVSTPWVDRTDGLLGGQDWSPREASIRWVDGDWAAFPVCHQCDADLPEGRRKVCSKVCERAADAKRKAKQRRLAGGVRIYPRDERGWYRSPTETWLLGGPEPPRSRRIDPAQPNFKGGYALKRQIMRGTPPMRMTLEHAGRLAA